MKKTEAVDPFAYAGQRATLDQHAILVLSDWAKRLRDGLAPCPTDIDRHLHERWFPERNIATVKKVDEKVQRLRTAVRLSLTTTIARHLLQITDQACDLASDVGPYDEIAELTDLFPANEGPDLFCAVYPLLNAWAVDLEDGTGPDFKDTDGALEMELFRTPGPGVDYYDFSPESNGFSVDGCTASQAK